jgi:hypothetical protein
MLRPYLSTILRSFWSDFAPRSRLFAGMRFQLILRCGEEKRAAVRLDQAEPTPAVDYLPPY